MTKLEFTCTEEKSVFLLKAARLYDEGLRELPEWISSEKEMPKERPSAIAGLGYFSAPVLVTWVDKTSENPRPQDRFVREGYTRNGKFVNKSYNGDLVPVAWMPLPGPAKEG